MTSCRTAVYLGPWESRRAVRALLRRMLLAEGHCPSLGAAPLESQADPLKPLAWQVRSCWSTLPWLKPLDEIRRVFAAVHLAGSYCCVCAGQCVPQSWRHSPALPCSLQGCAAGIVLWALWGVLGGHTGWQCPCQESQGQPVSGPWGWLLEPVPALLPL